MAKKEETERERLERELQETIEAIDVAKEGIKELRGHRDDLKRQLALQPRDTQVSRLLEIVKGYEGIDVPSLAAELESSERNVAHLCSILCSSGLLVRVSKGFYKAAD